MHKNFLQKFSNEYYGFNYKARFLNKLLKMVDFCA